MSATKREEIRRELSRIGTQTLPTQRRVEAFDTAATAIARLPSDEAVVVLRALFELFRVYDRKWVDPSRLSQRLAQKDLEK